MLVKGAKGECQLPQNTFDDKSTLVQVISSGNNYLSHIWLRSLSPCGVTMRPRWVKFEYDLFKALCMEQLFCVKARSQVISSNAIDQVWIFQFQYQRGWISYNKNCHTSISKSFSVSQTNSKLVTREREIKFIGLFEDRGHWGPYSPYKPFNHNLYIGIIIFPHIDNPQSTGYN